jgi:hypothetical protein
MILQCLKNSRIYVNNSVNVLISLCKLQNDIQRNFPTFLFPGVGQRYSDMYSIEQFIIVLCNNLIISWQLWYLLNNF